MTYWRHKEKLASLQKPDIPWGALRRCNLGLDHPAPIDRIEVVTGEASAVFGFTPAGIEDQEEWSDPSIVLQTQCCVLRGEVSVPRGPQRSGSSRRLRHRGVRSLSCFAFLHRLSQSRTLSNRRSSRIARGPRTRRPSCEPPIVDGIGRAAAPRPRPFSTRRRRP